MRQTDGQTDIFRRQRPRYAERRAGKNASRCNRDVDLRKTAQRPMLVDANPPVNSLVYVWATVIGRYNRSDVVLGSLVFVLVLRRRLESDLHPADARLSAGRRPCNYRRPSSNRRTPQDGMCRRKVTGRRRMCRGRGQRLHYRPNRDAQCAAHSTDIAMTRAAG